MPSSCISSALVSAWEEPYRTVAAAHLGWLWTHADGFVSFASMIVRKLVGCDSDAVVPHACGRWAATRAIGGHVPSGTSPPSRARGRSQIGR